MRLQIEISVENENSGAILEGNRVDILNPRKRQEREGIAQKIITLTGYASVRTEKKKRIVRNINILVRKESIMSSSTTGYGGANNDAADRTIATVKDLKTLKTP